MNKWHIRFLQLAEHIATWSKDPSTKVGAVIVDKDNRIISTGYNGLAHSVCDTEERLADRNIKYAITLHSEENAILFAKQDLKGCSIYISGLHPCAHCASLLIQSGIKYVYIWDMPTPDRWKENFNLAAQILFEAGVEVIRITKEELNE